MIISTNWLKKFTEIDLPADELATLIGARLVEIEETVDLSEKYKDVIVARVVECSKLENSDHLNVTKLDDGGVVAGVERDENGLVQVVCGAANVREGLLVAWLPPESIVPETFSSDEPFVLGARKLRGVMSNGMIASARELDLFDEHEGILEIDSEVKPGTKFAEALELNDTLLDIENKSLTHRPDAFGVIGFAREVAGIQGKKFTTPEWLADLSPDYGDQNGEVETPRVTIDDEALSARYQAIVMSGADAKKKSPLELQTYLARSGVRPINAVVDITNYLMLLTGQPLHAFDYDKLVAVGGGAEIHVRGGRENEKLELLDGRTVELSPDDIVIAAGETAVGLAGAMGGANTEIDENTKNIIIESATFNLYNLRATQMRHGIFSEAITRFTKGQPAELTAPVLAEAMRMMESLTGAKRVSGVADSYPVKAESQAIELTAEKVNDVLGTQFTAADVMEILQNVEFTAVVNDQTLAVTPPYWRADIHIPEDVIEEIGRLSGFDLIAPTLPRRDFTAVRPTDFDELRAKIRSVFARAGANEVLTYSFVHGDVLQKAGQKPEESYRITNSISPDLQYYRQALTPSLLTLVHPNIKAGYDDFAVFELNKTHNKVHGLEEGEGVPGEINMLALVVAHKKPQSGAAFYEAKNYLDFLASRLGLEFSYQPVANELGYPVTAPFEYRRSAMVTDVKSGEFIGMVGEYKKSVAKNFKLPEMAAGFEIGPEALLKAIAAQPLQYRPLSKYPSIERDICFQVNANVNYQQIVEVAKSVLAETPLETSLQPLDLYHPADAETKNVTVRIKLTSHERTLTGDEANAVIERVSTQVIEATGAAVI